MTVRAFEVPEALLPVGPARTRGLRRDEVRLLVAGPGGQQILRFHELPAVLEPGDLLVVNTSATLPAALDGARQDGRPVAVHLATELDDGELLVELRADGRVRDGLCGERLTMPGGRTLTLLTGYPDPDDRTGSRLWRARFADRHVVARRHVVAGPAAAALLGYLYQYGRPISYGPGRWPLADYQTVFAQPAVDARSGSSEMPSAGRPFSRRLLRHLAASGIGLAAVALHTGVSSLEAGELPLPERYVVPAATALAVGRARDRGARVVAVGTTVVRALETVPLPDGRIRAGSGITDLVLGPSHPARVVDAMVTGWHDPDASHLLLLEAVAGPALVTEAYARALSEGLLWHEFGDSCLLLPGRTTSR